MTARATNRASRKRKRDKRAGRVHPVSHKVGYRLIVSDSRVRVKSRLYALKKLAEFQRKAPEGGFLSLGLLSRIIRAMDTPPALRLAAIEELDLCTASNEARRFARRQRAKSTEKGQGEK